jgi:hypothetical protein
MLTNRIGAVAARASFVKIKTPAKSWPGVFQSGSLTYEASGL